MLKTHWRIISWLERVGDNIVVIGSFFLAYFTRDEVLQILNTYLLPYPQQIPKLAPLVDYTLVIVFVVPFYNIVLTTLGAYRSMRFSSFFRLVRIAAVTSIVVFLSSAALLFILKIDLSRTFVGLFCAYCGVLLLCERYLVLSFLRYWRIRGKNFRNMLIVGTGDQARAACVEIVRQPELGINICGFVDIGSSQERWDELPAPVVADADTFEKALKKYHIDEVLCTDLIVAPDLVQRLAEIAAEEGVGVTLVADIFSLEIKRSGLSYFGPIPLIHYSPTPGGDLSLVCKRLLDIAISSTALVLLSPLLVGVAIAVKLDSPGPVLFRQKRVGLNGRTFRLYKFRSMADNAVRMQRTLRDQNEMNGPVFKMKEDPRITKVGRFIRKYSIDELPQFFNVFRGDMSLVGPRPPLPSEVSSYMRTQRRRLSMRPGLTCIWQVSGRNEIPDFETWAKLDLEYIDNWSLLSDFKLLLKTIPVVFSGDGR